MPFLVASTNKITVDQDFACKNLLILRSLCHILMENDMTLENATDFIYKNCSGYISHKIREKKLPYRAIYKYDPKIIERICRCIVVPKRTPYLIQDSVRNELKEKLAYKIYSEILWRSEKEIKEKLPALFLMIMSDLANDNQYKENIKYIL